MPASLQPEIHNGTDFPGHPGLSQPNEVAAACEFQGYLQSQSKVCLDIIWITKISAVLGPFLCWKAILLDVDLFLSGSSDWSPPFSGYTCYKVNSWAGDLGCHTMVPLALPTTFIPRLDCLSHIENQIKHHWLLFQSQICIVAVKEAK